MAKQKEMTKRKAFKLGFWDGLIDKEITPREAKRKAFAFEDDYLRGYQAGLDRDYFSYNTIVCGFIVGRAERTKLNEQK